MVGTGADLPDLAPRYDISQVLIAIPSRNSDEMTRMVQHCRDAQVPCKTVPGIAELIGVNGLTSQIRDVAMEDLLDREPVRLSEEDIRTKILGHTVMVTGAAGSIGSELCRQLAHFHPRAIVGFDNSETALFHIQQEMNQSFPEVPFIAEIGNIQNRNRIQHVLDEHEPSVLYHAAAYKHVPMMEASIFEAVENNVLGTHTVALAAAEAGVRDFVMISSDKAVNPTNIMGATKRAAELIIRGYGRLRHEVRVGAIRKRTRQQRKRGPNIQAANRRGRTDYRNAPGDAALLHDHSGSFPVGDTGLHHGSWRRDIRARYG